LGFLVQGAVLTLVGAHSSPCPYRNQIRTY
jgi:hypothetical protein